MTLATYPDCATWCVTGAGIVAAGETLPRRTTGEPVTLQRVAANFGARIHAVSPAIEWQRMLAALLATEGGGHLDPGVRYELGEDDFSFGGLQMLTSTAAGLLRQTPSPSMPRVLRAAGLQFGLQAEAAAWAAQSPEALAWRALLEQPSVAVDLAHEYCRRSDHGYHCGSDPVMLYAAYNGGEPRVAETLHDAFGLVSYFDPVSGKTALDRFAAYFGDACVVIT